MAVRRTVVYGGSFNPMTLAHEAIVGTIAQTLDFSAMLVCPAVVHAYGSKNLLHVDDRAAVCRAALRKFQDTGTKIDVLDIEGLLYADAPSSRPGSTYILLRDLRTHQGYSDSDEVFFVVGQDQAEDISNGKWYFSDRLVSEFTAIVVPRADGEITRANCHWVFDPRRNHIVLPKLPEGVRDLSSTKARAILASLNRNTLGDILSQDAIDCIKSLGLYA